MPHVIVKLWPGETEQTKTELTEQIVASVTSALGCGDDAVSVAFEEIAKEDWGAKVYQPDVVNAPGKLYKKPGYTM